MNIKSALVRGLVVAAAQAVAAHYQAEPQQRVRKPRKPKETPVA